MAVGQDAILSYGFYHFHRSRPDVAVHQSVDLLVDQDLFSTGAPL